MLKFLKQDDFCNCTKWQNEIAVYDVDSLQSCVILHQLLNMLHWYLLITRFYFILYSWWLKLNKISHQATIWITCLKVHDFKQKTNLLRFMISQDFRKVIDNFLLASNSTGSTGNCYFLVFQNACLNLTFTCPGQSGKRLCSILHILWYSNTFPLLHDVWFFVVACLFFYLWWTRLGREKKIICLRILVMLHTFVNFNGLLLTHIHITLNWKVFIRMLKLLVLK